MIRPFFLAAVLGPALALSLPAMATPRALTDADYHANGRPAPAQVQLGRLLFFDKILSGNANISCATCHHPLAGSGDGLALPVGAGGRGLGMTRDTGAADAPIQARVPRNAPALFNLGLRELTVLFHDGRLAVDPSQPSGFVNPAGDALPSGLDNVLAAQAMFPVTSAAEMAGQPGENPVADAAAAGDLSGPNGVWAQLADRVRAVPEYALRFARAFSDVRSPDDIAYRHIANAIAAFELVAFRADASPYDQYLRGEYGAMGSQAQQGMALFFGEAGCGNCHGGALLTDQRFYSIAVPQIGPGKGDGALGRDDFGRERVSASPADRYRFRVPALRNVALTAPYGHDGAFDSLETMVRHHLDPYTSLAKFDPADAALPPRDDLDSIDGWIHGHRPSREALAASNELVPRALTDSQIADLMAFLHALTDPGSLDLRALIPTRVPSGLPIFD